MSQQAFLKKLPKQFSGEDSDKNVDVKMHKHTKLELFLRGKATRDPNSGQISLWQLVVFATVLLVGPGTV